MAAELRRNAHLRQVEFLKMYNINSKHVRLLDSWTTNTFEINLARFSHVFLRAAEQHQQRERQEQELLNQQRKQQEQGRLRKQDIGKY